jgi:hypothetical protein
MYFLNCHGRITPALYLRMRSGFPRNPTNIDPHVGAAHSLKSATLADIGLERNDYTKDLRQDQLADVRFGSLA